MAETKVDMNELSKKICEDVGGELKAVVKPCPSTFIKVYKAYYNKATFSSCCAFDGPPKLELMQNAFAVHCYYVFSIFVFTVILRAVVLGKYGLSPNQEFDLINFILLFFAFVWVLTITKYNESCCLNRFVNTAIFTAIMAWFALGAFLSARACHRHGQHHHISLCGTHTSHSLTPTGDCLPFLFS